MLQKLKILITLTALLGISFNANSESKRIFSENEFISIFSGKPQSRVIKYLGEPDSKEISIKPKGASSVIGRPTIDKRNPNKKDRIEMWYYSNLVRYSPKKTYLKVELTLLNNRCVNIAFFNQ